MKQAYRTIQDALASPWAASGVSAESAPTTDRILRSTKLEDSIYADLRSGDEEMDELESAAGEKLRTFPALSRDIYQSFYPLALRRNEESALSGLARKFNRRILDHVTESEDYPTISMRKIFVGAAETCPHPALRATVPRRRGKGKADSVCH